MWAVIPVKALRESKRRLSSVLSPNERVDLMRAMLEDVLTSLQRVEPLAGVLVVTPDPDVEALACSHGARVIVERGAPGLNSALGQAAEHLDGFSANGLLALPADLPMLSAKEITLLLRHHGRAPSVTLVSDRHGLGTNALACSPPGLIPFKFGRTSFSAHLEAARQAGALPRELSLPSLELDVDTPEDLLLVAERLAATTTSRFLSDSGLADRLTGHELNTASGAGKP